MNGLMFEKPAARVREKADRQREREKQRRAVYREVEHRDNYRCRACSRRWDRRLDHHHHLTFRSQGGKDTTANLFLICRFCHADIHAYRLAVIGTNANRALKFERRTI